MPSPFPGMDPYLEDPALWPDVHHRLIDVASEFLLVALRPKYFVQIDERLYVADDDDDARSVIVPDLRVRELDTAVALKPRRGGVAAAPGIEVEGLKVDVAEARLAVLDREMQRVVTVIEILSPANKIRGSAGHKSYQDNKEEILSSQTNFVEIDLLRTGPPLYTRPNFPRFDYMAQVWRWTAGNHRRWVWPMRLQEPLLPIPIPVRLGDDDATLDLQAVLNTAYDRAGYDLRVDYTKEPRVALAGEAAGWARGLFAAKRSPPI